MAFVNKNQEICFNRDMEEIASMLNVIEDLYSILNDETISKTIRPNAIHAYNEITRLKSRKANRVRGAYGISREFYDRELEKRMA